MQPTLFDDDEAPTLLAAPGTADLQSLAARLPAQLHLGTSSWHFPGWQGLVWGRTYDAATLSRHGLTAYGRHPLLRTVSVDRGFHRPMDAATFACMGSQVPSGFRFMVKAPASVADATLRDAADGTALQPNPRFLEPALALDSFVRPAVQGLGDRLGVLVFQLSPLPARWLRDLPALFDRLAALLAACRGELPAGAWQAVEVRDAALLTPAFADMLKAAGARYCLGLHERMPALDDQLPLLRALWPGPLVCRWNLPRGLRYEDAKRRFAPFDRLQAPAPATRTALARVVLGTVGAGPIGIRRRQQQGRGQRTLVGAGTGARDRPRRDRCGRWHRDFDSGLPRRFGERVGVRGCAGHHRATRPAPIPFPPTGRGRDDPRPLQRSFASSRLASSIASGSSSSA